MEPRAIRLAEFLRRLQALPPAGDYAEACRQIEDTLNQVEDELTAIPYNPAAWRTDHRMYHPQEDSRHVVPEHPKVFRFRSRFHNIYVAMNGAIEVGAIVMAGEKAAENIVLSKLGADGRGVWHNESD